MIIQKHLFSAGALIVDPAKVLLTKNLHRLESCAI